jgi:hypothetical protein
MPPLISSVCTISSEDVTRKLLGTSMILLAYMFCVCYFQKNMV